MVVSSNGWASSMSQQTLRVVAISDDEADRIILRRHLAELKAEVSEARTPGETRTVLARGSVDLVILDDHLGAEDELEILRDIRASGQMCPVIFLTGQGNENVAAQFKRAGRNHYLVKDELSPALLRASIERVLAVHAAAQEQPGVEQSLIRMATEDRVTGLLNKNAFIDLFVQELACAECYQRPPTLIWTGFTESTKRWALPAATRCWLQPPWCCEAGLGPRTTFSGLAQTDLW